MSKRLAASRGTYKGSNNIRASNTRRKIMEKLKAMPSMSESRQRARIELAANALRQILKGVESKTSYNLHHLFVQCVPSKMAKDPSIAREQTGRGTKTWQENFLTSLSSRDIIEEAVGSGGEKFWGATETADIEPFLDNYDNGDGALISAAVFPKDSDLDAELAAVGGEPTEIQPVEDVEEVDGEEEVPASMVVSALEKIGHALSGIRSSISLLSDQVTALKSATRLDAIREVVESSGKKVSDTIQSSFAKLEAELNGQKKTAKGIEAKVSEGVRLMNAALSKMDRRDLVAELAEKLTPMIKDAIVAEVAALKESQDMLSMELSDLTTKLDRYKSNVVLAAKIKQATEQMGSLAEELRNER